MDAMPYHDAIGLLKLVEVTSDAIAVCADDGTILHVNHQLLDLLADERKRVIGSDINDLLFSATFERTSDHRLPFSLDGEDTTLSLRLTDGSAIPVLVRAVRMVSCTCDEEHSHRVLVVIRSLEEKYTHDRQMQRVLSELQSANKRLSGTLSVIIATVGVEDLSTLLDTVLNKLCDALDADGSTIYFFESKGFRLRDVSTSLKSVEVPKFVPHGVGVPSYVLSESCACRLSILPQNDAHDGSSVSLYDLDKRHRQNLRVEYAPPFRSLIGVPVCFGTRVLGVIELGWLRPTMQRAYDVEVLKVICEYLSVQLVELLSSLRARRSAELSRSIKYIRDSLFQFGVAKRGTWPEISREMCRVLRCKRYELTYSEHLGCFQIALDDGRRIALPGEVEDLFFSTTSPAASMSPVPCDISGRFRLEQASGDEDLTRVRLSRFDQNSPFGRWLHANGLPGQGAFVDPGPQLAISEPDVDDGTAAPANTVSKTIRLGLAHSYVLLRDDALDPIDDMEYDYILWLAHEYESYLSDATQKKQQGRIAQMLQVGIRNTLGSIPGITTDALYSSATRQALVGGDFYTLVHLPDDCAVMILGDVSGKGIEAASMSALVKTALTAYAWEGASPERMCRSLNSMLMRFSRDETFATMFIVKIDQHRRRCHYCSAGNPPALLVHPAAAGSPADIEQLSVQSGVVGAFDDMVFRSGSFSYGTGDILFMYTDGAIEARNEAGEFFGEKRLRERLLQFAGVGIEGLCRRMLDTLDDFTASALDDDIALVALRFDRDTDKENPS